MPAAYPIPPWLQPTDAIGAMSRGAELGQRAASLGQNFALAQQRLDSEQQNAEREAQIKEEALRMQQDRESQQLAVEDAYNQARIGLQRSDQEMQAEKAARDFATAQKYQARFAALSQMPGMDPGKAAAQAAMEIGPDLFQGNASGFGQMMRQYQQSQPVPPPTTMQFPLGPQGENEPVLIDSEGKPHFPPRQQMDPLQRMQINEALKEARDDIKEFNKDYGDPLKAQIGAKTDPEGFAEAKARRDRAIQVLRQLDPIGLYGGTNSIPQASPPQGTNTITIKGIRPSGQSAPAQKGPGPLMLDMMGPFSPPMGVPQSDEGP